MNLFVTYHIITLFPDYFAGPLQQGLLAKAAETHKIQFKIYNLRDYTPLKHRQVDDQAYGGGPGMVLRMEPLVNSLREIQKSLPGSEPHEVIVFTPSGENLNQPLVNTYAGRIQSHSLKHMILYCGRYEGFDERFLTHYVHRCIRIGECVFMGGEVAALLFGEAVSRLLPGVVGNEESLQCESFMSNSDKSMDFDYPVYTRPQIFEGLEVPKVLLSGNHKEINSWRKNSRNSRMCEL